MSILKQLLAKGFLPKEVPPAFSTDKFAQVVTDPSFVPENYFKVFDKGITSRLCRHNSAMLDGTSRPLHIPHPMHFFYLCKTLEDAWTNIASCLSNSQLSISTPNSDPNSIRAYIPKETGSARLNRRLQDRACGNFLVKADVANCYGSIYTHSIPWALHTKLVAKSQRNDKLIGNLIDKYIRNGQDGQTIGIPVGPDTSFIIAELILSSVDNELHSTHSDLIGFRFYDDYEIVCSDEFKAKQILATIENCLAEYELSLNRRKTSILRLPDELDYEWLTELRRFKFSEDTGKDKVSKQQSQLIDFANSMFRLSKKYPNAPVLRYALVMLLEIEIVKDVWNTYQNLLIQIYRSEPQLSHLISHQLLHYKTMRGYVINEQLLKDALSDQIAKYVPTRATNEIAWALWMAIVFEIKLNQSIGRSISNLSDNIVAILAINADKKGLFESVLDMSMWESKLVQDNIYSEDWLLAYEVPAQEWRKVQDGSDYININPCFGTLKGKGVMFYDEASYIDKTEILKKLHVNSDFYTA